MRSEKTPFKAEYNKTRCPYCDSTETEVISQFGSSLSDIMLTCNTCGTTFNKLKWENQLPE